MAEVNNVPDESAVTLKQGAYLEVSLSFDKGVGIPFDLTGYTIKVGVRTRYGSDSYAFFASSASTGVGANKVTVDDATGGLATWLILPTDTTLVVYPSQDDDSIDLPYDVELHKDSDATKVYSPIRGVITLIREVTRT